MVTLYFWLFISTLTLTGNQVAKAHTEEENFDYINKVLKVLNVYWECQLPTYEEIDELQKSFQELEDVYGPSLESKLSSDQKLVRKTLLDQWTSFQSRMTSAVVIRSAKKRSFLGKVEAYQKGKYGFSLCTQVRDIPGPVTDRIFEKNPIVRYVKHLETGYVPESNLGPEKTDLDKNTDVIHTPISKNQQPEESESAVEEESSNTNIDRKVEENYDPLADIPVPSAQDNSEIEAPDYIITETTPTPTDPKEVDNSYTPPEEALSDATLTTDASELKTEVEDEMITEAAPMETNTPLSVKKLFESGAEYVDDDADDKDLNRLDKVEPIEWNIDPIYGYFRWPDENPGENYSSTDVSIKTDWNKFLEDPYVEEIVEEEQQREVEQVTEEPEYVSRRLSPKELRRKRKELLDKISGERRSREQDQLNGFSHTPEREHQAKKDRWTSIADNNFCRIDYNRDYIGNTRPVKAVKSLFSGSSKKKVMMMSRV